MRQASVFLDSLKKGSAWRTVFITIAIFYFLGVLILRIDSITSLFSNLGFVNGIWPVVSLFLHPFDTFSLFSLIIFLLTAKLFAFHIIALRLYTEKRFSTKNHQLSFLGVISSLLGCLACCGSVVIAGITGFIGISLGTLPFGGQEIGILGLILSLGALIYTVRKIDAPLVC